MASTITVILALFVGFFLDQIAGDPSRLPHPVVGFGKAISFFERKLNRAKFRILKGAFTTILLVSGTFLISHYTIKFLNDKALWASFLLQGLIVFYCLAGLTLRREVKWVFEALGRSTDEGRRQLARIVGRDTQQLNPQQIRTAALETLAENLSDGVVAPLFWFAILGAPGMLAYKMINTLDSMIGYKNERFLHFGRFAARLDDVANYLPARLTALLMLMVAGKLKLTKAVFREGKNHSSPNSGYPEAALALLLQCRFGGPSNYFGKPVEKPYIGSSPREITHDDMYTSIAINHKTEWAMLITTILILVSIYLFINKITTL